MLEITAYQKIWNEEQIKYLIQTNRQVLYKSLLILYDKQTDAEKVNGNTSEHNGVGFNAYDAPFLCAMVKSYNKWGSLTYDQRQKTIPLLLKYSKQLVKEANSDKYKKKVNIKYDSIEASN